MTVEGEKATGAHEEWEANEGQQLTFRFGTAIQIAPPNTLSTISFHASFADAAAFASALSAAQERQRGGKH
jgi:hypothetical protein